MSGKVRGKRYEREGTRDIVVKSYEAIFCPGSGWVAFFTSILVWGVGVGSFQAAFNNFLV
jgi:hypothetical protein